VFFLLDGERIIARADFSATENLGPVVPYFLVSNPGALRANSVNSPTAWHRAAGVLCVGDEPQTWLAESKRNGKARDHAQTVEKEPVAVSPSQEAPQNHQLRERNARRFRIELIST
jgi:hypothetical protein